MSADPSVGGDGEQGIEMCPHGFGRRFCNVCSKARPMPEILTPAEQKVRDAELLAREALGNHDPNAWSLVRAATARRDMVRAARG